MPIPRIFVRTLASVLISVPLLLGCQQPVGKGAHPKGPTPQGKGGVVDGGGGGDFIYNSREAVVEAIKSTWDDVISWSGQNPVYIARNLAEKIEPKDRQEELAHQILDSIFGDKDGKYVPGESLSENTKYIREKKLRIELEGYCSGPHDQRFMASVTRLDRQGEMCISAYALMRLPTSNVKYDLIGLFVHEAAHLNGFDEDSARTVQQFVLKNLPRIFNHDHSDARHAFLLRIYFLELKTWPDLINYDVIDENYVRRVAELAKRIGELYQINLIDAYLRRYAEHADYENLIRERVSSVKSNIFDFARALHLRLGQRVTAQDLRSMRQLSLSILEIADHYSYLLFGPKVLRPIEGMFGGEVNINYDEEKEIVSKATRPETLTDPNLRPKLYCTNDSPLNEFPISLTGAAHSKRRCGSYEPDLMENGTDGNSQQPQTEDK